MSNKAYICFAVELTPSRVTHKPKYSISDWAKEELSLLNFSTLTCDFIINGYNLVN